MHYVILFLYICCASGNALKLETDTETKNGKVRGHIMQTVSRRDFVAFEGIPYAKPPVGENRFKDPEPAEPWTGTWEATKLYKCLQYNHYGPQFGDDVVQGEEDCLYVNVYTPRLNSTKKYNVIVFIHGGWFTYGSGGPYGPKILLDRDVVYVTFNYRLGPLGFMSTEDEVLPGNFGMKDQVMALKWIKENIASFSGNPESVTISGLSAGGASVHLHTISPLSKGLFTRAISQSGHSFDSWVLTKGASQKTKQIAAHLGCPTDCNKAMVDCLKIRPARNIVDALRLLKPWMANPVAPLAIVVDKHSKNPFLPEHPYILVKNGKINDVPFMISHTSAEGLDPAADFMGDPKCLQDMEKKWDEIMPYILHYNYTADVKHHQEISRKIKDYYFKEQSVSEKTYPEVVQLIGDRLFVTESGTVAKMQSAVMKNPLYYYFYTYRGAHSMSELGARNNINYGCSHGDDTITIISTRFESLTTEKDRRMSKIMVDMWIAFSKMGVPYLPDIDWKPVSKNAGDLIDYVQIDSPDDIKGKETKHFGHFEFWRGLHFNELQTYCEAKDEL